MAVLKLSPTRSNLIYARQRLALARQGYELLNRKRDVLVIEILRMIEDAERVQRAVEEEFRRAYATIEEARAAVGSERVHCIVLSRHQDIDMRITPRSIMGVVVPSVEYHVPPRRPLSGFGDTSVLLDQAQQAWEGVLALMGELSQKVTTVWRLALELRRTQRRVNALENIFIPTFEETVVYIQQALEEKDREELFRLKRAKARMAVASTPDHVG